MARVIKTREWVSGAHALGVVLMEPAALDSIFATMPDSDEEELAPAAAGDDHAARWDDPAFREAFERLPAIERDALELARAGKRSDDIGRLLGVHRTSAARRVRSASRRVRSFMAQVPPSAAAVTTALAEVGASPTASLVVRTVLQLASVRATAKRLQRAERTVRWHLERTLVAMTYGSPQANSVAEHIRTMPRVWSQRARDPVRTVESLEDTTCARIEAAPHSAGPVPLPPLAPEQAP